MILSSLCGTYTMYSLVHVSGHAWHTTSVAAGSLNLKIMDTDSTFTLGSYLTRLVPDSELTGSNLLISILSVLVFNQHLVFDPRYESFSDE